MAPKQPKDLRDIIKDPLTIFFIAIGSYVAQNGYMNSKINLLDNKIEAMSQTQIQMQTNQAVMNEKIDSTMKNLSWMRQRWQE